MVTRWTEPTLERMKWITFGIPPLVLGMVEILRQAFFPTIAESRVLYGLFLVATLLGMWLFAWGVTTLISRMREGLLHHNQELLALHHASMAIAGDLKLETVLQRVVDEAAMLVGARYGAISLSRTSPNIEAFVTYGVDGELHRRLGSHPMGTGLLGVPVATGQAVRIPHISADPRSRGFPAGHPAMDRLLGVPVSSGEDVVGNLYLADKHDGTEFTTSDEGTLVRFAALAAIAIENAVLHERVQELAITEERERIAREMHDSLAQVLAYVNTKSQAARTHLVNGDADRATAQIDQLAQTAREAYVDVREGIFALRSAHREPDQGLADALESFLRRWQEQFGIPVRFDHGGLGSAALSPLAELHLLRLVQEALSNVRKHASASDVSITMEEQDGSIRLRIADNGGGFDPQQMERGAFPRFGLATMRERAEACGGRFALTSAPGKGTTIDVCLPGSPRPGR